jgi:hypothetical protein
MWSTCTADPARLVGSASGMTLAESPPGRLVYERAGIGATKVRRNVLVVLAMLP